MDLQFQILPTLEKRIDLNDDLTLQKKITIFFKDKVKKWNSKCDLKIRNIHIKNIYIILLSLRNRYNINWYDMRTIHYYTVKDYLLRKMKTH